MGRKGNWFSSVKKALSPEAKEKKDQLFQNSQLKKKWFGKQKQSDPELTSSENVAASPPIQPEDVNLSSVVNGESDCAGSVEVPTPPTVTTSAAETEVAPTDNVPDTIQPAPKAQFIGKAREEVAAIKIQTAFRGYLARRALRALRGLGRLKTLMKGSVVKRQAANTLRCMQTLSRVQSQIRFRRIRMLEETQALQKQLLQKHARELENFRMGEEWDDSLQSKEQVEANLLSKYEAAMRRERALAYSFSHQQTWKNSSRSVNPMFMDPSNPTWGWSWLERWTASRPWESRAEKEQNNENSSVKSIRRGISAGEISKSYTKYQLNAETNSPTASVKANNSTFESPSNLSKPALPASTRKTKPPSPSSSLGLEDDLKSVASLQSERVRRHSMGAGSVRDDESIASSSAVPSYMTPTKSARAKSKLQNPFAIEKAEMVEEFSPVPTKKRLSFTTSPALPRRHSGPPKIGSSFNAESPVSNGVCP